MKPSTMILAGTCAVVAVLGLALWRLDESNAGKLGGVVSALAAVAAVGIAIWAALRRPSGSIRVSDTGLAAAKTSGTAVSGLSGRPGRSLTDQRIDIEKTGGAEASDGGQATSGAVV
ncbi:hypothetical protein ACVMYR_32760 [Micromonospora sp. PTRAS2]